MVTIKTCTKGEHELGSCELTKSKNTSRILKISQEG
jgi:hypothetical protein